ncbi:MAG TPA: NAD(P)-dependent oxidoreductase [Spongiibacteraceae bacterium]|nr:NAD(P)-dependent oxidoreductase [Spongiibacteraceae bacterium]
MTAPASQSPVSQNMAVKNVLLTGAFGGIGRQVLGKLLAAGHNVTCLDLRNPKTEKIAAALPASVKVIWGNICEAAVLESALRDIEVVVHMAGIIPPLANSNEALATNVNVDATKTLLELMQRLPYAKRLIFASSMGVAGLEQFKRTPPLGADVPPTPTDHYGQTKADCEALIRDSQLDWTILRIAACPHEDLLGGSKEDLAIVFNTPASSRIEFVHFEDVGLAFANAVNCDAAIRRILFIGGGASCQLEAFDFYTGMFKTRGIEGIPRSAFKPGQPLFFGDWLDTKESQALLKFQRHSLQDFYAWATKKAGIKRYLIKLIAPLARKEILKQSPYYQ